jgi:pilus assembly protein Flp/PilA
LLSIIKFEDRVVGNSIHFEEENVMITKWFALKEKGQGLVEYALILLLIAVALAAVLPNLKNAISSTYQAVISQL